MVELLFDDIFKIERLNPDGKKFDKVTRIEAKSEKFDMFMHLDINSEIYPLKEGEKFSMALAPTLNLDGTPDTGYFLQGNRKSLADRYEYVMQGKLFRISESSGHGGKAEIPHIAASLNLTRGYFFSSGRCEALSFDLNSNDLLEKLWTSLIAIRTVNV